MAYFYNNRLIREGRGWRDNLGTQHPPSWSTWSHEEKLEKGLTWQEDPQPYDNRFWWDAHTPKALDDTPVVNENGDPVLDENGNQVITPGLKTTWKKIVKQQAGALLDATDWYVVRNSETGEAIPQPVSQYRSAVRAASNSIESVIDSAQDHAEFVALFEAAIDDNGHSVSPPISQWPESLE